MLPSGQPLMGHQQQQQQTYQQMGMQQASNLLSQQLQGDKSKSFVTLAYPFQTTNIPPLSSLGTSGQLSMHALQNSLSGNQPNVSYPAPRALRPGAGFTSQPPPSSGILSSASAGSGNMTQKHRVFTGTITKLHDNFGFVDGDVFFQNNVCAPGLPPKVGERALVDAVFNATMPFKWNATRVEVLSSEVPRHGGSHAFSSGSGYNAVPPPLNFNAGEGSPNVGGGNSRSSDSSRDRGDRRARDRSRDRDNREREAERERERRREERQRERDREREREEKKRTPTPPARKRSRSPKARSRSPSRRRTRPVLRYNVQVPKITLDMHDADVLELKRRYGNMYIPSDFFATFFRWMDAFPANLPLKMDRQCSYHIISKHIDPLIENTSVLDPPDADYAFSAKVMLISLPTLEEFYRKSCELAEDMKDANNHDSFVHPTRLINFLVGVRGKNETLAIGGPWSPSLDGANPETNPSVLIKTAIRTTKALTNIDLSQCTQWYRFLDIHYRRGESVHKGKVIPARVETVVIFIPDIWTCMPTYLEWEQLQLGYTKRPTLSKAAAVTSGTVGATVSGAGATSSSKTSSGAAQDAATTDGGVVGEAAAGSTSTADGAGVNGVAEDNTNKPDSMDVESHADRKTEARSHHEDDDRESAVSRDRRPNLPDQPHILIHPSRVAKAGKFNCSIMSLSVLLDYRTEDTKEHSFEVNLFAEVFNEMLMRDFGFRIYRAMVDAPQKIKPEDKDKDGKDKKDATKKEKSKSEEDKPDEATSTDVAATTLADKPANEETETSGTVKQEVLEEKEEEMESLQEVEEEASNASSGSKKPEESKERDRGRDHESNKSSSKHRDRESSKDKRKERVKMRTADPGLLLAFVYFDISRCGYIQEKDMEEILYTLGLCLSRAQTRKLLQKVVSRDMLYYRKLTDKASDSTHFTATSSEETGDAEALAALAVGNRTLLASSENIRLAQLDGKIVHQGSEVDVANLLKLLERSETRRLESEGKMVALQLQLSRAKETANISASTLSRLASELDVCCRKLEETEQDYRTYEESCAKYMTALDQVAHVVEPSLMEDEDEEEVDVKTKHSGSTRDGEQSEKHHSK